MKVYYMNGAVNDFMVIDARGLTLDYPALARKCCAITGADGFMAAFVHRCRRTDGSGRPQSRRRLPDALF